MSDAPEEEVDVEAVAEEAKESFTLIDSIKNRDMRTLKLDLGYDEVNSEKLIQVEDALAQLHEILDKAEANAGGLPELKKVLAKLKRDIKNANAEDAGALAVQIGETEYQIQERENLLEGIAPLQEKLKEMEASAEEVRAQVNKESLSVELRAIPYKIARGSARRARKALGITDKGIPEDLEEDFAERQMVELAYDQVVRFRDNKAGVSGTKLTIEQIETIRDFMPMSQSGKFFTAVNDLQYKNAISETAIAQADF